MRKRREKQKRKTNESGKKSNCKMKKNRHMKEILDQYDDES